LESAAVPRGFSPFKRRLARRRERLTSRRGGLIIAALVALLVGGGFIYWQWQVHEALEAASPTETMGEECADLAEANESAEDGSVNAAQDDAELAAALKACEEQGLEPSGEDGE
jgi:hypothetical protein